MDKPAPYLLERATVKEQPFTSNTPFVGALLVWFRSIWNSVATRWYVRAIVQQQNEFNHLLVKQLDEAEKRLSLLDHQNVELRQQVASLTTYIQQLKKDA